MMAWEQELELARRVCRLAGESLRQLATGEVSVLSAQDKDIKLQADQDTEALILQELKASSARPVLGEETGAHGAPEQGPFWVVDPLDGSLNFSRGLPWCCVSLALVDGEDPVLGCVYDFHQDKLYSGLAAGGAWCNGEPMAVSTLTDPGQGILATGFPSKRAYDSESLGAFVTFVQRFKKVRMFGTAALSLTFVAAGLVDAYAEDDIMLWDVAAGLALVQGAGGHVDVRPSERLEWGRVVRASSTADLWQE